MAFQVIVFQPKSVEVVVAYEGKIAEAIYLELGFRVPTLFTLAQSKPYSLHTSPSINLAFYDPPLTRV